MASDTFVCVRCRRTISTGYMLVEKDRRVCGPAIAKSCATVTVDRVKRTGDYNYQKMENTPAVK